MGNVTKTIYNTSMYWLSDDRVYLRTQGEQTIKSCTLIVDSSACYGNRSWRPSNSVLICFPGWPTGHDQRNNKQQTANNNNNQQTPSNNKQQLQVIMLIQGSIFWKWIQWRAFFPTLNSTYWNPQRSSSVLLWFVDVHGVHSSLWGNH